MIEHIMTEEEVQAVLNEINAFLQHYYHKEQYKIGLLYRCVDVDREFYQVYVTSPIATIPSRDIEFIRLEDGHMTVASYDFLYNSHKGIFPKES